MAGIYFSHDASARNDNKILNVRMKYGVEGYGIYFMLIERLREKENYMESTDYNALGFDFRVDSGKVKDIVNNFGLFVFTDDKKYFYSESLINRMSIMEEKDRKKSEAGKKAAQARWGNKDDADAMRPQCEGNANKRKEIKEKNKSKENIYSVFSQAWTAYPNKKGKSAVTKKAKEELEKLGLDKVLLAIKHYKQDVENQRANGFERLNYLNGSTFFNGRYQDFIDPGSVTPLKPKPGNKFHNFQGSTDFTADDLEAMARKKMENYGKS